MLFIKQFFYFIFINLEFLHINVVLIEYNLVHFMTKFVPLKILPVLFEEYSQFTCKFLEFLIFRLRLKTIYIDLLNFTSITWKSIREVCLVTKFILDIWLRFFWIRFNFCLTFLDLSIHITLFSVKIKSIFQIQF